MPTIDEVVAKYISLRDKQSEISKRHEEELKPIGDAMGVIEAWLLNQMNELGVDSFKTPSGTPYKAVNRSVKLTDAEAFKGHVFAPALEGIYHYLHTMGYGIQDVDLEAMQHCLQHQSRWGIVDFRAGKKGIVEEFETHSTLPPGVSIDSSTKINVRRS